ncbi:unnamed protein product [Spirodela intermedia]|uniref:Alpha 1,4-glycosyltransferase domain-containing protein n=1 Tax=Spirodela intermedia TaxID=51605 RepID=A0A7I8IDI4_SPIIN|nr:unnamed protein product [Spirodela intermedia]CAA6655681.1 unnamed protein product [Spirodela intermedia]
MAAKEEAAPLAEAHQSLRQWRFLQKRSGEVSPQPVVFSAAQRRRWSRRALRRFLRPSERSKLFAARADEFFLHGNSTCEHRFFMTWISPLKSFGERELFVIESLFKFHPHACLLILSNTMDTPLGAALLAPFLVRGHPAALWLKRLLAGGVDPGEVPLGQNLSNLLRHAVLYKFGGVYLDADVIVLRSFSPLRNAIGAQAVDLATGNWSRLNNAVMAFDKGHPLLFKFIQEFSLTFDGNKWGHNGPYLVSRVAARVAGRPGFHFTVLPPAAFYPFDWSRIESLFRSPRSGEDRRRLSDKLRRLREASFALHLWNRHSKTMEVEEGSIVEQLMSDYCVFCNDSASSSSSSL